MGAVRHLFNDYPVTPFYDVVRCSCGWRGTPHSKITAWSMWREAHLHVRRGAENTPRLGRCHDCLTHWSGCAGSCCPRCLHTSSDDMEPEVCW